MGATQSNPACSLTDAATALALAMLGTGIQLNSATFVGNCDSAATFFSALGDYSDREAAGIASGAYFSTGSVNGSNVFETGFGDNDKSMNGTLLSTSFSTIPNITSLCSGGTDNFYDATYLRMDVSLETGFSQYSVDYIYGTDEGDRTSGSPQADNVIIAIDGTALNTPFSLASASNVGQGKTPEYWHFDRTSPLGNSLYSSCDSGNIIEITVCDAGDSFYDTAVAVTIAAKDVSICSSITSTTSTTTSSTTATTSTSTSASTTDTSTVSSTASSSTTTPEMTTTSMSSGTSTTTSALPTTTTSNGGSCIVCLNDQCLQDAAMPTNEATSFCSDYLASVGRRVGTFPEYLSACTDSSGDVNTASVSSVCSCVEKMSMTSTPTTTTTTEPNALPTD